MLLPVHKHFDYVFVLANFRISVTFEMRTTEYSEIYISIDAHTTAERVYKG